MKKSKVILVALCAVLLVAASVMGTLAYLTSTDEVVNTFTVGNINIWLEEARVNEYGVPLNVNGEPVEIGSAQPVKGNSYKLIPGHTYIKNPRVNLDSNSDPCFVFVKVRNDIAAIEAVDTETTPNVSVAAQMIAKGWTRIDETNGIWVYGTETAPTKVLSGHGADVFDSFTIHSDVTDLSTYQGKTIVITGYGVQAAGFEGKTPVAIWNEVFGEEHGSISTGTENPQT